MRAVCHLESNVTHKEPGDVVLMKNTFMLPSLVIWSLIEETQTQSCCSFHIATDMYCIIWMCRSLELGGACSNMDLFEVM